MAANFVNVGPIPAWLQTFPGIVQQINPGQAILVPLGGYRISNVPGLFPPPPPPFGTLTNSGNLPLDLVGPGPIPPQVLMPGAAIPLPAGPVQVNFAYI